MIKSNFQSFPINFTMKMLILLISFTCFLHIVNLHEHKCDTKISKNGLKWHTTDTCTISQPPCLNERWQFQKRCCRNSKWDKGPICYHIQHGLPKCPNNYNYDNIRKICWQIKENSSYPPKCQYEDIVPFNIYKQLIDKNITKGPIWMPVQRDLDCLLRWTEFTRNYKSDFNQIRMANSKDTNCVLYYNSTYNTTTSCNNNHSAICAYKTLDQNRHKLCHNDHICRQSDYDLKSKCFCIGNQNDLKQYQKAEFQQSYQNIIYTSLTNQSCLFALEKINNTFFWSNSQQEINYTNWALTETFVGNQGLFTKDGWTLTNQKDISCVIYEEEVVIVGPFLELVYDKANKFFLVTINNPNSLKLFSTNPFLCNCFTDSSATKILYKLNHYRKISATNKKLTFYFYPLSDGPGHYWCEGISYPNLTLVKSNVVFLRLFSNFPYEFVTILQVRHNLSVLYLDSFSEMLHIFGSFYTIRLMKIIDFQDSDVVVNFHLTCNRCETHNLTVQLFKLNSEHELSIKPFIQAIVQDVRSSDYCFKDKTIFNNITLTWPLTAINQITYPLEYCFTLNAVRLNRHCKGNFIDGAIWSQITDTCQILNQSNVTNDLINLLNSKLTSNEILQHCLNISLLSNDIKAIDLFLFSEIFSKIQNDSNINLKQFINIISNLHEINDDILMKSQLKMNTTDRILQNIDTIALNSNLTKAEEHTKNILVVISSTRKVKGLIVYQFNGTFTFAVTNQTFDILNKTNIVSALYFNSKFKIDTKLVISIFLNKKLFNTINDIEVRSQIFGVVLSKGNLLGFVTIYYRILDTYGKCAFWHYGTGLGYWKIDGNGNSPIKGFTTCQFSHITHFALVLMNDNIDDSLHLLEIITDVNCSLSLFGLFVILLTGLLFRKWRSNDGNKILLNFSFAVTLQIITFFLSTNNKSSLNCTVIGVILHYSTLSQFCWMLVIAILQFKRFVEVLGVPTKYVLLKGCLCSWLLPLLPVCCVYFLDPYNYIRGHTDLCYPSNLGLYLGVWLPICLIVAINLIIFLNIIYNVVYKRIEIANKNNNEFLFQWRLGILLFFMLGLTWIFGLFTEFKFGLVFIYLFCFTATLQGFVLFIFFIVFNYNTRYLYLKLFKIHFCNR